MNWKSIGLMAIVLLSGCESSERPASYTHTLAGVPNTLDPARISSTYEAFVVQNLFESLYRYQYLARPYVLTPSLAVGFPEISDDRLEYRFQIQPGHQFPADPAFAGGGGREVTANDVVYSLLRHFDPSSLSRHSWMWQASIVGVSEWQSGGADYAEPPPGLRVIDRYRFEIILSQPQPDLLHTLATPYSSIVPREGIESRGEAFGRDPIGSGPYRLVEFNQHHMRLRRSESYPERFVDLEAEGYRADSHEHLGLNAIQGLSLPILDEIDLEFVPDGATRWLVYRSDEAQFIRVPDTVVEQILADRDPIQLSEEFRVEHRIVAAQELGLVFLSFDFMAPPFHGRRGLRCAVIDAIDWNRRNEVFFAGLGSPLQSLLPEIVTPDIALGQGPIWPRIAARDWPTIIYGSLAGLRGRQEFDLLRAELIAVGMPSEKLVHREFLSLGELIQGIGSGEVNVFLMGWQMDFPDALNNLQLFYGANANPGPNFGSFHHVRYDEAFSEASVLPPGAQRRVLVEEMSQILVDECAVSPGIVRRSLFMFPRDLVVMPDNGPVNGGILPFVHRTISAH